MKKEDTNVENVKHYRYWYCVLAVVPGILSFLALHNIHLNSQKIEYSSYKEACLSGEFTSLSDLHQYVTEPVHTVQGELERDDFLNNHYWQANPVLMKGGAAGWPIITKWTDEYLLDNFADVKFYVDMRKHHYTTMPVRTRMSLKKFIRNYKNNDWYLDSMSVNEDFTDDMIVPRYLNFSGIFESKQEVDFHQNFYLSSGNTNSPLHYDGYANLLTVLDGRKEWLVASHEDLIYLQMENYTDSPNLSPLNVTHFNVTEHPGLCEVKWERAILEKGDTLFVPVLYPHHVYSPPGRNMALGMWFFIESYTMMLDDADFDTGKNVTGMIEAYRNHIKTRPRPCDVINCEPLSEGSLREHVSGIREEYSRDTDLRPAAELYVKHAELGVPGMCYGTGLPGGSIRHVYENTKAALNMGYKCVDTAAMYQNEVEVGRAVRDSDWDRQSVTIITKIMYDYLPGVDVPLEVRSAIEGSLERLDAGYIDVLLIHDTLDAPPQHLTEMWKVMESFVRSDKVKMIGLSNADMDNIKHVQTIIATVPISIIQNFITPFHYDKDVFNYCQANDIVFMGFGISGDVYVKDGAKTNPVLSDDTISHLAEQYHTDKYAILYNWAAQKHIVVISRSTRLSHMRSNLGDYRDVLLHPGHIKLVDSLYTDDDL